MIRLENVSKVYGQGSSQVTALKNINLHVPEGQIYGVIGLSGAGKSTLIRCVNLLERPTSGQVLVDNQDVTRLSSSELRAARHQMGMIFQHFNLLSSRTVFDNVAFPLELLGYSPQQIETEVNALLDLVGLADKRDVWPAQLSGGQKQRVAIARALASKPKVLLCDEATSALDPQTTHAILQLLRDINRKLKLTILLITHEMEVVREICHQVALISGGRIAEQAPTQEFFNHPRTDLARQFVRNDRSFEFSPLLRERLVEPAAGEATHPLVQLRFTGDAVEQPVLARLIRQYGIDFSILQANFDAMGDSQQGVLVAELIGNEQNIQRALGYLRLQHVELEVIGHVRANRSITA